MCDHFFIFLKHQFIIKDIDINQTQHYINNVIKQAGKCLSDFNLPEVENVVAIDENVDLDGMAAEAAQVRDTLNPEQVAVATAVIEAVQNIRNGNQQHHRIFFLDGPGGSGKSYVYNYLINLLTSQGYRVATSAYTGIAAILLKNGITIHSLFKLPVPVLENSTCNVKPTSEHAE